MRALKGLSIGLLTLSLALASWFGYGWWRFIHTPLIPKQAEPKIVELNPGTGMLYLQRELTRQGLLNHPYYFAALVKMNNVASRLKAGEYLIPAGTTPPMLLNILTSGKVVQHQLTLIEGWNSQQILAALAANPAIAHTQNLDVQKLRKILAIEEPSIEGWFYPDTYSFTKGTSDINFLARAHAIMRQHLLTEWQSRAPELPLQNPYQALILASLIEKEAKMPAERALVSGVIIKRLQLNMRLQIDAAVIYGLGDNYAGKLHKRDLALATPYNTYLNKGLPPTPIAIPSLASLKAALHPIISANIFYVARGDGSHYFSTNLSNHNAAVQAYLRNQPSVLPLQPHGVYSINLFGINQMATQICSRFH